MRPLLPNAESLVPYLKRIDRARYYSNHGPLVLEFEERLAAHFGVLPRHIVTVSNATMALTTALRALSTDAEKHCLLPSWTFVASAAAACAADMRPHFIDVSRDTWMVDIGHLLNRNLNNVAAVMVVSAFGSPVDTAACDSFTERTTIPVVIDGAASFDSVASSPIARPGRSPIVVSFHATKVLGVGEGAAVISTDEDLVRRIRQLNNFGTWGNPDDQLLGFNGKLSEYHAAVGLAAMDAWPHRRSLIAALTQRYRDRLSSVASADTMPGFGTDWVSCYCNVVVDVDVNALAAQLRERGIETRRWWQRGVHEQPAYSGFSHDDLSETKQLGRGVIGLPFYHDLTEGQMDRIVDTLTEVLSVDHLPLERHTDSPVR